MKRSDFRYFTGFGLNIGSSPVLFKAILSVESGGSGSVILQTNADSLNILGLPSWAVVSQTNKPNDTIVVTLLDDLLIGHEHFDVELIKDGVTTTITKGLRISISIKSTQYAERLALLPSSQTLAVETSSTDSITNSRPFFFPKTNGELVMGFAYFRGYRDKVQFFTKDMETGTTDSEDIINLLSDMVHNAESLYLGGGKSVFLTFNGGFVRYHIYDTALKTWEYDFIPKDTVLQASQASTGYRICQGTDGKVYVIASNDGGTTTVAIREIDVAAKTSMLYNNIPAPGGMHQIGADTTNIYCSSNPYGDGDTFTVLKETYVDGTTISSPTVTVLETTVTAKVHQRKHGVVYEKGGVWNYLHAGIFKYATDPIDVPSNEAPWVGDTTNLKSFYNLYNDIPTKTPLLESYWDTSNAPNGDVWVKYAGASLFVKYSLLGVLKHSSLVERIKVIQDNKIIVSKDGYLGYLLRNLDTQVNTFFQPVAGRISTYVIVIKSMFAYLGGYFDSTFLKLNSNEAVDNTTNNDYDANNIGTYSNPLNLDTLGDDANITKPYGAVIASNGMLYFSGKKIRSGDGGGVASYNEDTGVVTEVAGFSTFECWDIVSVGDYIVVASIGDGGSSPLRYSVIDISTNLVVRYLEPNALVTANHGRLVTDGEFVFGLTTDDAETETYFYKMDINLGTLLKSQTYAFDTDVGKGNDSGKSDFVYHTDGFLYTLLNINSQDYCRVDTTTMCAEPLIKLDDASRGRFDINSENTYFVSGINVVKRAYTAIAEGFISLNLTNRFLTISNILLGTGGVTKTYIIEGAANIGVTLVGDGTAGTSTVFPMLDTIDLDGAYTGIVVLKFTLSVRSGTIKINAGEWRNSSLYIGYLSGVSGVYGVGTHNIVSSGFNGVDVEKIKLYTDGQNYPTFDYDITNIRIEVQ